MQFSILFGAVWYAAVLRYTAPPSPAFPARSMRFFENVHAVIVALTAAMYIAPPLPPESPPNVLFSVNIELLIVNEALSFCAWS